MPVLVVRWCLPRKCTELFSEWKLLHLPCYCSFSAVQIIRPFKKSFNQTFFLFDWILKKRKTKNQFCWMHTLSNFSSISFSSSERSAMIRSLAARGCPSLISRGSKGWKNKIEVFRGVETLQVYINAINFIGVPNKQPCFFSYQTDSVVPNGSRCNRLFVFLHVSYFKEKIHIYTNNVEM